MVRVGFGGREGALASALILIVVLFIFIYTYNIYICNIYYISRT